MTTIQLWTGNNGDGTPILGYIDQADTAALGHYIAAIAERLGLADWTILIDPDAPSDSEAFAEIVCTYGQRRALIRFDHAVRTWPPDRLRRVVVHELVHCHLDRMDTHYDSVEAELGPQAGRLARATWRSVLEDATDNIADAWARDQPLIDWAFTGDGFNTPSE